MFLAAVSLCQMFLPIIYWLGFVVALLIKRQQDTHTSFHTHITYTTCQSLHCPLPCIMAMVVVETLAVYQASTTSFCRTLTLNVCSCVIRYKQLCRRKIKIIKLDKHQPL